MLHFHQTWSNSSLLEYRAAAIALWGSEVIREALLLLEEREQRYEVRRQELRHKIAEGLAQLDRGEGIPGEQVFTELDAELDTLEKTRKTG